METDETQPTPPPAGDPGNGSTGPVRIEPKRMVVSGTPKRGRAGGPAEPPRNPILPDRVRTSRPWESADDAAGTARWPRGRALGLLIAVAGVVAVAALIASGTRIPDLGTAAATSSPEATAAASGSPTGAPTPAASPGASEAPATPAPPTVPPPSGGYAVTGPCPDADDCFLYTVRTGDTLATIGAGFGVTRTGILALNPELTAETPLAEGDSIRVPTPSN